MTDETSTTTPEQPDAVAGLEAGDEVELTLEATVDGFRGPPVTEGERVIVDAEALPFPVSVDPSAIQTE